METFIKFFIAYWIIGLLVVLFSLANDEVKKGIKDDPIAYVMAAIAVSLLYPIALIRAINERRKSNNEGNGDI